MSQSSRGAAMEREPPLSLEERKSLTHGEFWIPESDRQTYRAAIRSLNQAGVPFVVSGLYAIYEYTGVYRKTKDLDVMMIPRWTVPAARVLKEAGFRVSLHDEHWLAKAERDGGQIDLIFGMGNGLEFVDLDWFRHSRPAILAAEPVRIAPAEEMIWHRLFISERHRFDVADIVHLILCRGQELDWERLLRRTGDHWRLLLGQLQFFDYAYPADRDRVPDWIRDELYDRARADSDARPDDLRCRGTLVSRFSFSIDVEDWGYPDLRRETVEAARSLPVITEIRDADVWDHIDGAEADGSGTE